jgi:hypothetical protein
MNDVSLWTKTGLSALLLACTLSACAAIAPHSLIVLPLPLAADEQACSAAGGRWLRQGLLGTWQCLHTMPDAGQACWSGAECQSDCLAPNGAQIDQRVTGTCAPVKPLYGCHARVEGGRASPQLCVD